MSKFVSQKLMNKMNSSKKGYPSSLLNNKYLLYFLVFAAFMSLAGYTMTNNYTCVAIFVLIAFITSCFSKNMIVVLVVAISFSQLIHITFMGREGFREGAEDMSNSEALNAISDSDKTAQEQGANMKATANAFEETADTGMDAANAEINKESDRQSKFGELQKETSKLKELEKQAMDLLNVQQEIINGLQKMEPMLTKAEKLSTKLESFSNRMAPTSTQHKK
jgi:hypothetical protein